jgi:uncharacterized protein Yka (UPF0111/DUF47 family)
MIASYIDNETVEVIMFGFFKKREDVFHKLIQEQASITFEGLKLLVKYLETRAPEISEELTMKEKEADEVRRILIDELIMPIARLVKWRC